VLEAAVVVVTEHS